MSVISQNQLSELDELNPGRLGIISQSSSAAMRPDARILVIGIGGMGFLTVCKLKEELTERIGKLDKNLIRFLSIDTDSQSVGLAVQNGTLGVDEQVYVFNSQIAQLSSIDPDLIPENIKKIVPSGMAIPNLIGDGANQIRLAGRISLMNANAFGDVVKGIQNAISGMSDFTNKKLIVHIVAGVGGGTGSGMVIDIPYIVRHVFTNILHLSSTQLQLYGHIFLPDTYANGGTKNYTAAQINSYAALKEIDHYMNIDKLNETYDAEISNGITISSRSRLFDLCTLVGGHPAANIVIDDAKKFAVSSCVEDMINLITSVYAIQKNGGAQTQVFASDMFTSASFLVNVRAALKVVLKRQPAWPQSAYYQYCCVGASRLKFPNVPLIENVVGTVWGRMDEQFKANAETLKQEDINAFEQKVRVCPKDIIDAKINEFLGEVDELFDNSVWNKEIVSQGASEISVMLKTAVTECVGKIGSWQNICNEAKSRANSAAEKIFTDPQKGPYYLEKLLTLDPPQNTGATACGFFRKIDGYYDDLINIIETQKGKQNEFEKARKKMEEEIRKAGIFSNTKKRIEEYKAILKEIYESIARESIARKLSEEYFKKLSERVGISYNIKTGLENAFLYYIDIIRYISQEVMRPCADLEYTDNDPDSVFALQDTDFETLKNTVLMRVKSVLAGFDSEKINNFAALLVKDIIENRDKWRLKDSPQDIPQIADYIRNFILNYEGFSDIVNNTFAGYFNDAYVNASPTVQNLVAQKIIQFLDAKAAPTFRPNATFDFKSVPELCNAYMIIPSNMGDWGDIFSAAIKSYLGNSAQIMYSPDQNSIYSYKMFAAMPVWAYSEIKDCETEYCSDNDPTKHIDGGNGMPKCADFPALFPKEVWNIATVGGIKYSNPLELSMRERISRIIDRAVEYGAVRQNGSDYEFVIAEKLDDDTANIESLIKNIEDKSRDNDLGFIQIPDFFKNYCIQCPVRTYTIQSINTDVGGIRPDSVDNVKIVISHQMQLFGKLESFIEYLDKYFIGSIQKNNEKVMDSIRRKDFVKFILLGLVFPESNNTWWFKLGDSKTQITSKMKVSTSQQKDTSMLISYMEYAAFKEFFTSCNDGDEKRRNLNKRADKLIEKYGSGEIDRTELDANIATYISRCNNVIEAFESMSERRADNSLTENENNIKQFYIDMLEQARNY